MRCNSALTVILSTLNYRLWRVNDAPEIDRSRTLIYRNQILHFRSMGSKCCYYSEGLLRYEYPFGNLSNDGLGWYAVRDGLPNDARALSMVMKDRFTFLGTWGKSVWKIPTTELLMTGEFIATDGEEIPQPLLKNDCSSITVTNPKSGIQLKWYKDGNLIPNETAKTLTTTGRRKLYSFFRE